MRYQDHTQGPVRPGGGRARSRWWMVGLAGVTGLALGTVGVAAGPAAGALGRPLTAADDRGGDRGTQEAGKRDDRGKDSEKKPTGIPVPCDADALIAAITLANARGGAVLDLAKDCTYLLTADIDGAGLPMIVTPITLNGGKHTTIERAAAVDQFRILTVDVGGDLTLNKLTITGGQTDDEDGGGILVNAGGALTTHHTTITRNIAGGSGGGIANNGTTWVKYSTVDRNTAAEAGGGIYSTGLLEIVKSHIDNNTVTGGNGGGVSALNSTVTVKGGSISGNFADNTGGLYVSGGIGTVTGTEITGNTARSSGGGAARAENNGQLTMRHVSLTNNTASALGGALFVALDSFAVLEDSFIKNNTNTGSVGGGIYNAGETVLRRTKVNGNQADQGGGIYNEGTISLFTTKVVENIATTNGGGIFNAAGTVNLNTATGTIVIKNRPDNCVNVPGCAG
nr:right-handed parallel beta-helix repeat-containing protein [Salinispora sp. H7-4]